MFKLFFLHFWFAKTAINAICKPCDSFKRLRFVQHSQWARQPIWCLSTRQNKAKKFSVLFPFIVFVCTYSTTRRPSLLNAWLGMWAMWLRASVMACKVGSSPRASTGTSVRALSSSQRWRSERSPEKQPGGTPEIWLASRRLWRDTHWSAFSKKRSYSKQTEDRALLWGLKNVVVF